MTRSTVLYIVLLITGMLTILNGGLFFGKTIQRDKSNQEAIEAGVAMWEVDAKTGRTNFVYLKPDNPERHKKDAIEAGVAEWQINPKSGERVFTFKGVAPTMPMSDMEHKKSNGLSIKVGD